MNLETLNACPLCGEESIRTVDAASNICECEPCGYVFDNPRPTEDDLIAFYSQPTKYDSWLAQERARNALWARRLKQLLRVRKPGSLLDVGAGIGQFLAAARPYFSKVYGTEVSESAIRIAREKYGLELTRGEIQDIEFGPQQFDNITLFHVLEHVPNPRLVIERCTHLLGNGGVLVIAVPNDVRSLRVRTKRMLGAMGIHASKTAGKFGLPKLVLDGSLPEIHLSHFTSATLKRLLEQFGFSVIRDTLDPYYVASGAQEAKQHFYYACCRTLKAISGENLYDTILMMSRKRMARG